MDSKIANLHQNDFHHDPLPTVQHYPDDTPTSMYIALYQDPTTFTWDVGHNERPYKILHRCSIAQIQGEEPRRENHMLQESSCRSLKVENQWWKSLKSMRNEENRLFQNVLRKNAELVSGDVTPWFNFGNRWKVRLFPRSVVKICGHRCGEGMGAERTRSHRGWCLLPSCCLKS